MGKRIKKEVLDLANKSPLLKEKISETNRVNIQTARKWFFRNDINGALTLKSNLELISAYVNVPESKLLEEVPDGTLVTN